MKRQEMTSEKITERIYLWSQSWKVFLKKETKKIKHKEKMDNINWNEIASFYYKRIEKQRDEIYFQYFTKQRFIY